MDEEGQLGPWQRLNPEVLALILMRLTVEERLGTAALVCTSWRETVAGPYCWGEIDLEQWCRRCNRPDTIDLAVKRLVRRSQSTFWRLSAYRIDDSAFSFLANRAKSLKVLQIPMSEVTDTIVERHAGSLANITVLDISNCLKITSKGIESFGKQCQNLTHLKRKMPPQKWEGDEFERDDTEAMMIANTMTGLHQLELCFGRLGDSGLRAILTRCEKLTHLDIEGCSNIELEGDLEEKCGKLAFYKEPWQYYEEDEVPSDDSDTESCSDSIS